MALVAKLTLVFGGISLLYPNVFAAEVILSDTRMETTDLNWQKSPEDGWIEMSNDDENQIPLRTHQVCKVNTPGQNNWVRTNYIEVDEAKKVYVEVKFSIRSCADIPGVAATCKETFNLYYMEADSPDFVTDDMMDENVFVKIDTVASDGTFPVSIKTLQIGPISSRGIHIAFQDTGACMIVFYMKVYYKTCDDVTQNLARFPSTVTGPDVTSLIEITGKCVRNALWTEFGSGPTLHCNSKGEWNIPSGSCQCRPGFEPEKDMTACKECEPGMFKSIYGNTLCMACPENSLSIKYASSECVCSSGYYRSREDGADSPCTKPPSKPMKVEYVVEESSVALTWSAPSNDGGRDDLSYSISCLRCDSTYTLCSECGDIVEYEPAELYLLAPQVSVINLSPHTNYRFRISSHNGVSKMSGREANYEDAMLTTSEAAPSAVRKVRVLERTTSEVLLKWESPSHPNGIILEYEIQYNSNGINKPRISRTNRTKDQTFRIKYLPPTTSFLLKVRAKNAAGYGLFSSPIVIRTSGGLESESEYNFEPFFDEEFPEIDRQLDPWVTSTNPATETRNSEDEMHLVIGIAIACTLLVAIVILLFIVTSLRRRRRKCEETNLEVYPFFRNAADLIENANKLIHRSYVDPFKYGPEKAMLEFATEIDRFCVKREDFIAAGEFCDVYKGLLRPTTPSCDETNSLMTAQSDLLTVAVKSLRTDHTESQKRNLLTEASILGQFNHENVVKLKGVVTRATPPMLITEYMENGSLDKFLEETRYKNEQLDISQVVQMLRDIANGMKYLVEMGYVHRDLAARNILVNDRLDCKISGFGISRFLNGNTGQAINECNIPNRWMAPEVLMEDSFSSLSDVWSFGITAWEILTHGENPFWEMPDEDVAKCIECGYRLPPPAFCPRVLHNLMLNCWNVDRPRRPTFAQIVEQLDSLLMMPERLQDTINNIPVELQAECIPESLDLSSLGQWLEDMNMTHYKDIMLRFGCVTAEQIIKLSTNQLEEMGINEPSMQQILINGAEFLRQRLEEVQNRGVPV